MTKAAGVRAPSTEIYCAIVAVQHDMCYGRPSVVHAPSLYYASGRRHWGKPFYEFERRKEFDGDAAVEECYVAMGKRLSAIGREGDDAMIIFGVAGQGMFRIG